MYMYTYSLLIGGHKLETTVQGSLSCLAPPCCFFHVQYLYLSREQRVTLFVMAVLIGVSMMLYHALRLLPLPVLYGIFLYIGVASLYGVQVSAWWQWLKTTCTCMYIYMYMYIHYTHTCTCTCSGNYIHVHAHTVHTCTCTYKSILVHLVYIIKPGGAPDMHSLF